MTRTTKKGGIPRGDRHAPRTPATTTPSGATAATPLGGAAYRSTPGWLVWSSLVLAVVSLLASAYLTYEHVTQGSSLACPEGQVVNCAKVTQSSYATFLGLPVAVLGLVYFVAVTALCLPALWRRPALDLPRLSLVGVGVAMVIYLVWAELFGIGAICLWCTVIHVATVLLFFVLLFGRALTPR